MKNRGQIMKKKFYSTIVAVFLVLGNVKPVSAQLIIDGTELAGKTAEWMQVVLNSSGQGIQQVMQGGLSQVQGIGIDFLKEYLAKFMKDAWKKDGESNFEKVEDSTQAKNTEILEGRRDAYQEAVKAEYGKDYNIAVAELEKEQADLSAYTSLCNSAKNVTIQKEQAYNAVKDKGGREETVAYDEYSRAQSYETDMCNTVESLKKKIKDSEKSIAPLDEDRKIVGTEAEQKYREKQAAVNAINANVVDETLITAEETGETDWEKIAVENYTAPASRYEDFYKRYFYNPDSVDVDVLTAETKSDKVKRERDFLLVNTTAHLLQVAASARREVPVRSHVVKEMYENTKTDSGETAAINAFAETRIENARALLLYAKLLSAKLQYMAAHDLCKSDVQLERDDKSPDAVKYGEFDMQHYVLTTEYLEHLVQERNSAEMNNRMINVQEENTEWRP